MNAAARMRRDRRLLPLFLLIAAAIYAPFLNDEIGQGNVASDLAAIESIVERGTFYINDSTFADTIDKFKDGEHFFSQKSPVFHLAAAPVYAALRAMGWTMRENPALCVRVLAFFMATLPMGWLLWFLWSHPWMARRGARERAAWTAAFAAGSLLTPFAVTLNHYTLASAALLGAWRLLCLPNANNEKEKRRRALWIGFYLSLSLACDVPPAFLFGAGVAVYYALRAPKQLPALIAGALPLALLYAALNYAILGSPLPPNMHESAMLYYEGSFWSEVRAKAEAGNPGYYQASYPRRLYHAALGHKGIYWMMPLLALATGWALAGAQKRRRARIAMLGAAAFPPLCAALTLYWAFDLSGGAYGVRHIFASVAPLYTVLAFPLARRPRWVWRALAPALALFGIAVAALGIIRPWSHNTYSAWPPADNAAWWTLQKPKTRPTEWIGGLINASALDPANGWLDYGLVWFNRQQWQRAAVCLSRAARLDPKLIEAWYPLGICFNEMGRPGDAWNAYAPLLALQPENVGALNNRGLFALRWGRADLARESFGRSLKAAPENAGALAGLLAIEAGEGRAAPDNPVLLRALKAHPEDPRIKGYAQRFGGK